MNLSKGEYTQFSLKGKLNLLKEFGTLLKQKKAGELEIEIYHIYDFYVQVFFSEKGIIKAEPIVFNRLKNYY